MLFLLVVMRCLWFVELFLCVAIAVRLFSVVFCWLSCVSYGVFNSLCVLLLLYCFILLFLEVVRRLSIVC